MDKKNPKSLQVQTQDTIIKKKRLAKLYCSKKARKLKKYNGLRTAPKIKIDGTPKIVIMQ